MTTANVLGKKTKESINLPQVFETPIRRDLIRRAVVALQSQKRQPYGTDATAGLKTSADYFGRRGEYRTTINRAMSRLPRIKTGGGGLGDVRRVPQSVGGRRAHPPKAVSKAKQMNNREYSKAVDSAIAATADKETVSKRGHEIEGLSLPLIFNDSLEEVKKTKDLIEQLEKTGLGKELSRAKTKKTKSILIVVGEDRGILSAAKTIPGVDAITLSNIDAEHLAPGAKAGRLTIWTKSALKKLEDGSA